MAEYASLRKIEFELCGGNLPEKYKAFVRRVLNDRNLIPAADVAPVVHGRWEYNPQTINTYGQLRCSICNWWTLDPSVDRSYSYCPNCGAKMDGGNDRAST